MDRRTFLLRSSVLTTGYTVFSGMGAWGAPDARPAPLYELFKNPGGVYRPFVRWWWNGDKVEKAEIARELRLMKDAGIGGVEINPIKFPALTDDLGKPSISWLSPEWIELLDFTLTEAAALDMTCDLIVGSGWPFGAEYLEGEERSQTMVIATHKLEGPDEYEVSLFDIFKEADPAVTSPFPGRLMEIMAVKLAPDPLLHLDQVKDYTDQIKGQTVRIPIPEGKHVLFGLVKIKGSMEVINGAPGANGPVLNHYNQAAVKKYLNHMSDAIQQKIGPLAGRIRSFFTDSMELEGANWCSDMEAEFKRRRGYDLLPYLPFTMFKTGAMGNIYDFDYGARMAPGLKETIERVRYDFDLTKTELVTERFIASFNDWCHQNKVLSRVQAYGRGYHPLEGSLTIDLPECETWIKYGIGKELSETDYHLGRAYTMVNKYVSSAAHLKGKKHISCEELTNTDMVFNATLEILKTAGDQSILSGVTHPVFHGFNYSPPQAPFPGWIRYGTFFNERNNWWPYFRLFTDYKARLSALLQQGTMFAEIAVLPPVYDMWSVDGAQNEPFPSLMYPDWLPLIWESIHQNGSACDYVSDHVILDASIKDGRLVYGPRSYHTLLLVHIERLQPATAEKLFNFVSAGGRIICVETYPSKSLGLADAGSRDAAVVSWVDRMKALPDRFIFVHKPESHFLEWYRDIQQKYAIPAYVHIDKPTSFVSQVRYQAGDTEWLFITNSDLGDEHTITILPSRELGLGKQAWIWDAGTGERFYVGEGSQPITLELATGDSRLVVFDKAKKGAAWNPLPATAVTTFSLQGPWNVEYQHLDGTVKTAVMAGLVDLKDDPATVAFSGTVIYRISFGAEQGALWKYINLGKVAGISGVTVNGKDAGIQWYGRRVYPIDHLLQSGQNTLEIRVVTTMGNYMKTLKGNRVAQYWTNAGRKDQPIQSMGLLGPVLLYS
ncbi:MAG TPA: glycosyl hydrolase [Puia sp.]|nr:glycosyl hydrolase [Puia sp.]